MNYYCECMLIWSNLYPISPHLCSYYSFLMQCCTTVSLTSITMILTQCYKNNCNFKNNVCLLQQCLAFTERNCRNILRAFMFSGMWQCITGLLRASHSRRHESSTKLLPTPEISHAILNGSLLKKYKTRKITPFTQWAEKCSLCVRHSRNCSEDIHIRII